MLLLLLLLPTLYVAHVNVGVVHAAESEYYTHRAQTTRTHSCFDVGNIEWLHKRVCASISNVMLCSIAWNGVFLAVDPRI